MNHERHFDADEAVLREVAQIRQVIVDLDRTVQIIDCDVATEEERVGVSDRSNPAYPILARALAARGDNLRGCSAALEQRIATIKVPMVSTTVLLGMDQACLGSRGFFWPMSIPCSKIVAAVDRPYRHRGSSATPPTASLYRERMI